MLGLCWHKSDVVDRADVFALVRTPEGTATARIGTVALKKCSKCPKLKATFHKMGGGSEDMDPNYAKFFIDREKQKLRPV
jgi:hypothetical protein